MWNLVMGGIFSSDGEEEEEEEPQQGEGKQVHHPRSGSRVQLSPASRERGDGSEGAASEVRPVPPSSSGTKAVPSAVAGEGLESPCPRPKLIHLPETNIKLEKLPPIRPTKEVELPQTSPATPLVQHPVAPASKQAPSSRPLLPRRDKEPKFVPYEPYKAAVTHLVDPVKKKAGSIKRAGAVADKEEEKSPTLERQSSAPEVHHHQRRRQRSSTCQDETAENGEGDTAAEVEKSESEKDDEIRRLKEELAEKDKQIRIQTQINTEVKRLLVASVGEDIEAKVDYLTQDKARLSADIRQYASKISRDFEEKEQLSVESNLWKSKFLACSVIVDELARWKASLLHRTEATEHNFRLVLHEHAVLWDSLIRLYQLLAKLRNAFDPLAPPIRTSEAASLLGLADHTLKIGQELKERLIGDSQLKEIMRKEPAIPNQMDTPAEEGLKEIISKPVNDGHGEYSELASLAVTGAAKTHLMKIGDKLTEPSSSFKSCTHCLGTVQNI